MHKALASLPPAWRHAGQATLLAAVYFAAARLALLFAVPPGYASPVWPPSGIAVAALLLAGPRLWPGIWIGSFAANLTVEASLVASAAIATGSTLQGLAAQFLIRRHVGTPSRFARVADVVKFVLVAAIAATIAPSFALLPLVFQHSLDAASLAWNWWTWWQGDCSGILLVAPLILSWVAPDTVAWTKSRALEGAAFWTLLVLVTQLVFTGDFARTFLLVPFIVWGAFRFGQRGVTTATAAICAIALWSTLVQQTGPFAAPPVHYSLLLLLTFISTLVVTGLMLSAVLSQLDAAMAELRGRQAELESRVRSRTAELEETHRLLREDIAARMRADAELVHAKVAAEKANEAKSQFLANMSHELRTPLNSLLILSRLLADNTSGNLNPKQVQFAQTIYASGMDLLTLINDLLDLAKIESGAIKSLHVAPVLLEELREELERTFRQVAQDRGLKFDIAIDPRVPALVSTDGARLKQVLKNLLANAFKFTQKGGVSLRVAQARSGWTPGHATLRAAAAVLEFRVADTGIGIAPDKQEVIFEAFQQADGTTSRQYGGTGLGLSISRELTQLFGGEIRLASELGKGSAFTLYLPLAKELSGTAA